ncbi:winged helix-turn-helix domain-containing protein [Sphingoaurantiacus capsulatus]|uniref:Winged helix-turn-helix domain-containing protein n=1 Tax=Sphingoaurantiacus capsulatus TaxID=1771310 RepID=A0ABV7X6D5_9SPHN
MNETFAPFRRRIDPSVEPPFRLGALRVSPATLEVASDAGVETLEPRVMQVLVALWRNQGEAVTRDDLSQLCWGGLIVGDDALNRAISRLRKVLAADPAVEVDTIPKIGYRLRLEGVAPAPAPVAAPRRRWPLLLLAIPALLALAFWLRPAADSWSAASMRPLTREAGTESYPALSPNGEWLAYAGGGGFGRNRDIRLQGLGVGESAPISLTATPDADELAPAWSPDGRRLAFVRHIDGQPCSVVVMSPPRGAERVVGRCRTDASAMVDWLGDDALVISDRVSADAPRRLFALDLTGGALTPLTDPPARATGDAGATVSPDGRRIAFRRTAALGADDAYVLDRDSGEVRPLTNDGFKASGLTWSADSRTLFISTNRGGDFGLWALDTIGGRPPQRVSLGLTAFSQMSADRHGRLAVQLSRVRANLVAVPAGGGAAVPITQGTGIDWDPTYAADGSLAFVSELSGPAELWVQRPGAAPARVTNLRGSYLYAPRWSPDGRRLAFIAVAQQKSDIYTVDADGSRLRRVTEDGVAKGSVAWGEDDTLYYTTRTDAGWRLMRQAGSAAIVVPAAGDAVVLRRGPDGTLYVRRTSDARLSALGRDGRVRPLAITAPDREAWEVTSAGIYAADGTNIRLTPWSGPARTVTAAGTASRPNFALRPDGAVVQPRLTLDEADLMLIELKQD